MTDNKTLAVSGQHYLFDVQAFAHAVLTAGGESYSYALRDRTTRGVLNDVATGASALGVIVQTTSTSATIEEALESKGLTFTELITSKPCVALSTSHPLVNAKSLTLEDLTDYPYIYFEQEENAPTAFAEEALADFPRSRRVAATDRASLSELIAALNGYTVTSGILVGVSDGTLLQTVPLESNVTLRLGYVMREGAVLDGAARLFVDALSRNLERYARL